MNIKIIPIFNQAMDELQNVHLKRYGYPKFVVLNTY